MYNNVLLYALVARAGLGGNAPFQLQIIEQSFGYNTLIGQ